MHCGRRAKWTDEEKDFIKRCAENIAAENTDCLNIKAKILKAILKDPAARPIFHVNHIRSDGIAHAYSIIFGGT